jgi:acyl-CoA synthetase (AMP-forming)/AMP-acid ligase II
MVASGSVGSHGPPPTRDGWLATGDLGFVRDGALMIVDREKDILIVRGVNYPTADVEAAVEQDARIARAVACSVRRPEREEDELVVFGVRTGSPTDDDVVRRAVRASVMRALGLGIRAGGPGRAAADRQGVARRPALALPRRGVRPAAVSGDRGLEVSLMPTWRAWHASKGEGLR